MYNQLAATSHEQDAENSELQAIFPAFSDLYFRLDLEGTILDCHQGQLTSSTNFPMAPETFLGQPLQTMLPPVVGEQFRAALSEVVETQALVRLEYTLTLQDQLHHYEAKLPAILILTKSCSSFSNAAIVLTSEKPKRARTVERTGVV